MLATSSAIPLWIASVILQNLFSNFFENVLGNFFCKSFGNPLNISSKNHRRFFFRNPSGNSIGHLFGNLLNNYIRNPFHNFFGIFIGIPSPIILKILRQYRGIRKAKTIVNGIWKLYCRINLQRNTWWNSHRKFKIRIRKLPTRFPKNF